MPKKTSTTKKATNVRSPRKGAPKGPKKAASHSGAHTGSSSDDRVSGERIPIQFLVDYKCDGNYLFDFCKDLGEGGIFIVTSKPRPAGSMLDLTFTIPDDRKTLFAQGKVIWVQAEVPNRPELTPGMGVQFENFSSEDRQTLIEFVNRYAKVNAAA